jgi:hypothetical protein
LKSLRKKKEMQGSPSRKAANDPAYRADYNIDDERNDERLG